MGEEISQKRGDAAFPPLHEDGPMGQEQRVAEREQFCGQLALENPILKKMFQRLEFRSVTQ
jgi:hypothetical protein